jgi:hypothetical protein
VLDEPPDVPVVAVVPPLVVPPVVVVPPVAGVPLVTAVAPVAAGLLWTNCSSEESSALYSFPPPEVALLPVVALEPEELEPEP